MSKLNVMELFARAKQQASSSGPQPRVENRVFVEMNRKFFLPDESSCDEEYEFVSNSTTSLELPEFISESSTISIMDGPIGGSGRSMAAGNQFLCLSRGEAFWVIDMTTGLSNDRSIRYSSRPMTDMEFNPKTLYLLFTDGIDVGIMKCVGTSTGVELNGSV